ncbi:MAG TPA: dienelactone hydrolase family protein [Micromonosporaceae bacterium]|jgi:dienelactone hydrolase
MRITRRAATVAIAAALVAGVGASASAAGVGHHVSTHRTVVVQDISISVPGQAPVDAWLVRPSGPAARHSLAGVIYLHWLNPPATTQNRSEFLNEALQVAEHGAVAILPDLTFPWTGTLYGDQRDVNAVREQERAVQAAYETLLAAPGVDPHRTAVIGHDYGAMYGSLLAAHNPNIRAEVYVAGDATWSNWFFEFFLSLPDSALPAYNALFAGLDPVDQMGRLHSHLYLQWAGQDFFIPQAVQDQFHAADPQAKVSVYPEADHSMDINAQNDRIPWLLGQLGLR